MDKSKYFEKVKEYKLLAKHEVGQNFLISEKDAGRIVALLDIKDGDKVLEIGPGAGSLSVLLSDYSAEATLLDIDEGLITKLKEDFKDYPHIHPILQNALKADFSSYDLVLGNLPYYITSSLIEKIVLESKSCRKAVLMVQKEAFLRLSAKVGTEDYGPLPILLSYVANVKREFLVPRDSFVPAPHIDSIVFSLEFKRDRDLNKASRIYGFVTKMFSHRRKTIFNNLQYVLNDADKSQAALEKANISPKARPETLTLDDYLRLLDAVEDKD